MKENYRAPCGCEDCANHFGDCGCSGDDSCNSCSKVSFQYADISLPVRLKPCAKVGEIKTECCTEPIVTCGPGQEHKNGMSYEVVITQTVCIKIPIQYSATADIGDAFIS